jgi:hypothetical protein
MRVTLLARADATILLPRQFDCATPIGPRSHSIALACLGRVKFSFKPPIRFRVFSVFPTTWGICSSLDGQPQWPFQMGF